MLSNFTSYFATIGETNLSGFCEELTPGKTTKLSSIQQYECVFFQRIDFSSDENLRLGKPAGALFAGRVAQSTNTDFKKIIVFFPE